MSVFKNRQKRNVPPARQGFAAQAGIFFSPWHFFNANFLTIYSNILYNKKTKTRKTQQKRRKYKAEEVNKTNYDKNEEKKRLVYDCGTLDCGNPVDAGKRL